MILGIIGIFIVFLLAASWGLGIYSEIQDGFLYNGMIIGCIILVGIFILTLPIHLTKSKKKNQRIASEDGEELASIIQAIENHPIKVEKVEENTLRLSLEEQYQYVQQVINGVNELSPATQRIVGKTHMSFGEMEQRFEENLKNKDQIPATLDKLRSIFPYDNKKINAHPFNKVASFNEIIEGYFVKRFGIAWDGHSGFHIKVPELQKKIESWRREKNQLVWSINQGVEGEKRIHENLKWILEDGHVMESVRIEHMDKSAESDIIYVGSTGIHSLEIKNFGAKGNWNIHISRDGQWQKVFPNGNREPMKDVGNQMNYHVVVKEKFLNEKLKELYGESAPKVEVKTAVVIANDTVMIDNDSDLPVLRMSSLARYLKNGEDNLSNVWQERIAAILEEHKKPGKAYEIPDLQAQLENLLLESEQLSSLYDLRHKWMIEMGNMMMYGRPNDAIELTDEPIASRKERSVAK